MKKNIRSIFVPLVCAATTLARAQGIQFVWLEPVHTDPYNATPFRFALSQYSPNRWMEITPIFVSSTGYPYYQVTPIMAGQAQTGAVLGSVSMVDDALPAPPTNKTWPYELCRAVTANGGKVELFGPNFDTRQPVAMVYEYRPNAVSHDVPIAEGRYPYHAYSAISEQVGASSWDFAVLAPAASGTDPVVEGVDTALRPRTALFNASNIYAAGGDNNASTPQGGARASMFFINSNGSVSRSFTKTVANTLANKVFTSYSYLWGTAGPARNFLVTNKTVHDSNANSFEYSYSIQLLDGSGNQLWKSSSVPGTVQQISVGSSVDIYVRGVNGALGMPFLDSYGSLGAQRFTRNIPSVTMVATSTTGVIVGDNEIDATGHHQVHLAKYSGTGSTIYSTTLSTSAAEDDYLCDLQFYTGRVFINGQAVPSGAAKYVWGAEFDQT